MYLNMKRFFLFSLLIIFSIFKLLAQKDTVEIAAVGDIMLGTDYPEKKYLPPNDKCDFLLSPLKPFIEASDIAFANLEGAFNDGAELVKKCNDPSVCYAFRTPQKYFACIVQSGLNLFSLANNHIFDFGMPAVDSTLSLIDRANSHTAGIYKRPFAVFVKDSVTYGFTAFSPNKGTNDFHDTVRLVRTVQALDDTADIVIVSFHMGAEGSKHQHLTRKTEMYYGENRGNPYKMARKVIDAGADIVFGHGPHVPRAFDLYKDRFIAYSLGNFCTYSRMNLDGPNGLAPLVRLKTNTEGMFIEGQIVSFKQYYGKGIILDKMNRAASKIQNLTKSDIPECLLRFEKNGYFSK